MGKAFSCSSQSAPPPAGRKLKADISHYDAELARYSGGMAGLQTVPAALAGKENSMAEDSRVLAAAGMQLEESFRQLEGLLQQKGAAERGGNGQPKDGAFAARLWFCLQVWLGPLFGFRQQSAGPLPSFHHAEPFLTSGDGAAARRAGSGTGGAALPGSGAQRARRRPAAAAGAAGLVSGGFGSRMLSSCALQTQSARLCAS